MAKKLLLFFDGTWNKPDEDLTDGNTNTNVRKLYEAINPQDGNGVEQRKWYDPGVGTEWYTEISGGVAGEGLTVNMQQGYQFLAENYVSGDEIFLFGFSRGAYTARSLAGMLDVCGLLTYANRHLVSLAYTVYRYRNQPGQAPSPESFRKSHCTSVAIKCLGVWDTVGAMGIPFDSAKVFNLDQYGFLDTKLSDIVENGFQALAIDEHRQTFQATLWNPPQKPTQRIEQTWFAGAHADVGGGYAEFNIALIPLQWMAEKAISCGAGINMAMLPPVNDASYTDAVHDSYSVFMDGAYKDIYPPYYRGIGKTQFGNESFDESVKTRLEKNPAYKITNAIGQYVSGWKP